jgi:hypothetical protein
LRPGECDPAFRWKIADIAFVFPSFRLKGKKQLFASIMVQKYLRPAAIKAGVLEEGERVRFGFHNLRQFTGFGPREAEMRSENGAEHSASRRCQDDDAVVRAIGPKIKV